MAVRKSYAVTGMTCEHCVAAVREEVGALPGVVGVDVDLVADAESTVAVVSDAPLDDRKVAVVLDEAGGYALAPRATR